MMIEGRHYRDILVLEITGALRWGRGRRTPSLRQAVEQGLRAGLRRMVLDLSHVSVMDSSALGDLAAAIALAEEASCRLRLSGPGPHVRVLLRAMRLDEQVPIDPDEASALRALGAGAADAGAGVTTPRAPEPPRVARASLR